MASPIVKWFENMKTRGHQSFHSHRDSIVHGADVMRQGGESVVVGGVLGAIAHGRPLDMNVKLSATNTISVPLDGAVGLAAIGASMLPTFKEIRTDLKNAGSAALAVASYRKVQALMNAKAAKTTHHGELGMGSAQWGAEDPLIAAARAL
jgi:chorismate synthase